MTRSEQIKAMAADEGFQSACLKYAGIAIGGVAAISLVMITWKWYVAYKLAVMAGVTITPKVWLTIVAGSAQLAVVGACGWALYKDYSSRTPVRIA